MKHATFICRYCGEEKPESERSPDHVLQAAIGSALIEPDSCHVCNQEADKAVDRPFVQDLWVREHRHRYGTRDRYGRTTPAPVVPGELEDGTKVLTIMEATGWRPHLLPSEEWIDEKTFRIGADASEADEVLAKKLKRLGEEFEHVEMGPRELHQSRPFVKHTYVADARMWPRFGAKVALALAPYALGDEWLHSQPANSLRATLWDKDEWHGAPPMALQPMAQTMSQNDLGRFFQPPEHVLFFIQSQHGPGLTMVLFGQWQYGVPLGEDWALQEQPAWWLDPIARTQERTTWNQVLQRIALRYGEAEEVA